MNTVSLTGILQRFEDKGSWVKGSISRRWIRQEQRNG